VVTLNSGSSEEQTQDSILKSIQSAAAVDPIMLELRDVIMKGFPNDKWNPPIAAILGRPATTRN
jgi:phage gp29-like protein